MKKFIIFILLYFINSNVVFAQDYSVFILNRPMLVSPSGLEKFGAVVANQNTQQISLNSIASFIRNGRAANGANNDITSLSGLTTPLSLGQGGTGASNFAVGRPILGNGTNAFTQGTLSGSGTIFATVTGTLTSGHCAAFDSGGNIIDGGACGGTGLNSSQVTNALGYTPLTPTGSAAGLTGLLSSQVTNALGYTPYSSAGGTISGSTTITGALTVSSLPGLSASVVGTGLPGLDNAEWFIYNYPTAFGTSNHPQTLRVQRDALYSGGGPGEYSAFWAACTAGANVADFEWCGLFTLDNYATSTGSSNNVAMTTQAIREPGAAETWASVLEMIDRGGADPTVGNVGSEIDVFGNGTDAHTVRMGINLVVGRDNMSGSQMEAGFGIKFTPSAGDIASPYWNTLIGGYGNAGNGIDLSNMVFSGSAIKLARGQNLCLEATSQRCLQFNDQGLVYYLGGTQAVTFTESSGLLVNGLIQTNVPLNNGSLTPGHYFQMNVLGTIVNVLTQ